MRGGEEEAFEEGEVVGVVGGRLDVFGEEV